MISYIITIIIIFYTTYMSLIYDSTSLVRLAVAEAMFLVVSFIYLLIRRKMMEQYSLVPRLMAHAETGYGASF